MSKQTLVLQSAPKESSIVDLGKQNAKIEKQNRLISKKNFNYYDLYKDYDEKKND